MRIQPILSFVLLLLVCVAPLSYAQEGGEVAPTEESAESAPAEAAPAATEPVKRIQPAKKETDGGKLFIVAYIVFWLLPLYLLWVTTRRVRKLEGELKELRKLIPTGSQDGSA